MKFLYGDRINQENIDKYKDLLSDSLFMCLEYRNLAAHGGRIYNYNPNSNIRLIDTNKCRRGLPQLLYVLNSFGYRQPYERLRSSINRSLTEYCHDYPDDLQRLEHAIGFEIEVQEYVWVNNETQKYHSNKYCSGMQNSKSIELKSASDLGYIPCKKCCK